MRRNEQEPQKKGLFKRAIERITPRGRKRPTVAQPALSEPINQRPEGVRREPDPLLQQWEQFLIAEEPSLEEALAAEQEREQQRQEARLRERQARESLLTLFYPTLERLQQNKLREEIMGKQTCQELEEELQHTPIHRYAKDIRERLWKIDPRARFANWTIGTLENVSIPVVTIKSTVMLSEEERRMLREAFRDKYREIGDRKTRVEYNKDRRSKKLNAQYQQERQDLGEKEMLFREAIVEPPTPHGGEKLREQVINHSRVGRTLTFSHSVLQSSTFLESKSYDEDGTEYISYHPAGGGSELPFWVDAIESLSFGIGYFDKRTNILPEAQTFVSDEALAGGVKACYIEASYEHGENERTHKMIVIPTAFPEYEQVFQYLLFESAKRGKPENFRYS